MVTSSVATRTRMELRRPWRVLCSSCQMRLSRVFLDWYRLVLDLFWCLVVAKTNRTSDCEFGARVIFLQRARRNLTTEFSRFSRFACSTPLLESVGTYSFVIGHRHHFHAHPPDMYLHAGAQARCTDHCSISKVVDLQG